MKRHTTKNKKKKTFFNSGLTMIEALIVIAIALPIMMAFMGAFNSLSKSQARSNDLESVQVAMVGLLHELTQEIHSATSFEITNGNQFDELSLSSDGEDSKHILYVIAKGQMIKNRKPFSSEDIDIHLFQVENVAPHGVPLLQVTINLASRRNPEVQLTQQMNISLRQNFLEPTLSPVMNRLSF